MNLKYEYHFWRTTEIQYVSRKTVEDCLSHVTFHTPKKLRIKLKFSSFGCGKNEYNILRLSLKSSNLFSYHSGLVGLAANCNAWLHSPQVQFARGPQFAQLVEKIRY